MKVARIGMEMHHGFVEGSFTDLTIEQQLEKAKNFGVECCYYKSPLYLSEKLDPAELDHYRQTAEQLGLKIDVGLGRINPFNTLEDKKVWDLADGDFLKGMEMQIQAGARLGGTDFIAAAAGVRPYRKTYTQIDRFRTDVDWEDQMAITRKFLKKLVPVLRDTGTRVCVETHEEVTSWDVLRMVEEVGDEYISIAYDTINVVARGEEPVAVAKRIGPYVRQMHCKDTKVVFTPRGLRRSPRPCGDGIVDFPEIFKILGQYHTDIRAYIEDGSSGDNEKLYNDYEYKEWGACIYHPYWIANNPDADINEIAALVRYAKEYEDEVRAGRAMAPEEYDAIPYSAQRYERLGRSLEYLKKVVEIDS